MAKRAELVGELLVPGVGEGVGVHRVEAEAEARGGLLQPLRIGLVPRNVQRDGRRRARQLLDDGAILDLVEDVARLAGAGKAREARAAGADAPGRDGDMEGRDLVADRIDRDAAAVELLAERGVVGIQRLARPIVGPVDHGLVDEFLGHSPPDGGGWSRRGSTLRKRGHEMRQCRRNGDRHHAERNDLVGWKDAAHARAPCLLRYRPLLVREAALNDAVQGRQGLLACRGARPVSDRVLLELGDHHQIDGADREPQQRAENGCLGALGAERDSSNVSATT